MNLDKTQQKAVDLINDGENVLVTGSAGTGKSLIFNSVESDNTIRCAPTGLAALNIGGITCHSLFGLPVGKVQEQDYFTISKKMEKLFVGRDPCTILLDEVSMLRADYLDIIDSKLRTLRRNNKPFGGVQMVMGGDFFQLEPVVNREEARSFHKKYKTPFCFASESWDFETIELNKIYRQADEEQIQLLQSIRKGDKFADEALDIIVSGAKDYEPSDSTVHLCCYNKDANRINKMWYNKVEGEEKKFNGVRTGTFSWSECIVPESQKLKIGCRVLIKANNPKGGYVNGDRGIITGFEGENVFVRLKNGVEVKVEPFTWEKYGYNKKSGGFEKVVEGTYKQIPILLGYAVSVHASQGQTLEDVALDIGSGCFASGMLYTALSRITDLRNLSFITDPTSDDIIVDKQVQRFYKSIQKGK